MRKRNTISNIIFGFSTRIIIIALGIIMPRLVLVSYGSDTNGFTSTVSQILTWLALLEAGIAQATLNSLYDPVSKKDRTAISKIMSASRRYYRKVTKWYALIVVLVSVISPFIIKTQIDHITVFSYILITGLSSVIQFYYLECWKQLLSADGKYYISQIIGMFATVGGYVVKILLIPLAINIAWIQFAYFLVTLLQLLVYKLYLRKHYPWVDFRVEPNNSALRDKSSFMVAQIASTIFTSTDTIVLSTLISTLYSSIYSVYGLIYHNLVRILDAIYFGTVFNLGQTWNNNRANYPKLHDRFDVIVHFAITATMSVAYIFTIPFVKLYTAGVYDINYVYKWLPLLFSLSQILSYNRYVNGNLLMLSGNVKYVSKLSIIEASLNVVGSIVLGLLFGINGVLLATVIALPVKVICCLIYANRNVLKRNLYQSIKIVVSNYLLFAIAVVYTLLRPLTFTGYGQFCFSLVCHAVVIYTSFLLANVALNYNIMKEPVNKILRRFRYTNRI